MGNLISSSEPIVVLDKSLNLLIPYLEEVGIK